MGMPEIPDQIDITEETSLIHLLESIALEELALAQIMNAEGEKLQRIIGDETSTIEQIIEVEESVENTLRTTLKKEMLLQFKLEDVLEVVPPEVQANIGTVTAQFNGTTVSDTDKAFYNTETTSTEEVSES